MSTRKEDEDHSASGPNGGVPSGFLYINRGAPINNYIYSNPQKDRKVTIYEKNSDDLRFYLFWGYIYTY